MDTYGSEFFSWNQIGTASTSASYWETTFTSSTHGYGHSFEWTTELWDRNSRPWATRSLNHMQGRMDLARGSRAKNRIWLEMLHLSDVVRNTSLE
jgi:hypothetical protein